MCVSLHSTDTTQKTHRHKTTPELKTKHSSIGHSPSIRTPDYVMIYVPIVLQCDWSASHIPQCNASMAPRAQCCRQCAWLVYDTVQSASIYLQHCFIRITPEPLKCNAALRKKRLRNL